MFKELMPKNETVGIILDTILITLGGAGGIAGLFTWRWKTKYQAKIQAEMQAKADELSQTLNEKITRRSKANDLLINRQYAFYDGLSGKVSKILNIAGDMIDVYCDAYNKEELTKERIIKVQEECKNICELYASACSVFQDWLNDYSYYVDTTLHKKALELYRQICDYYEAYTESCKEGLAGKMTVYEFKQEWIRKREMLIGQINQLILAISNKVKLDANIT